MQTARRYIGQDREKAEIMNCCAALMMLAGAVALTAGCRQNAPTTPLANEARSSAPRATPTVTPAPDTEADRGPDPVRPGLYGNVQMFEESGDLGGVELEVHGPPKRMVEMTLCEGWCNSIVKAPYRTEGDRIVFTFREAIVRSDGTPAPDFVIPFRLRQKGQDVIIESDAPYESADRLRQLKARDGLLVAAAVMESAKTRHP